MVKTNNDLADAMREIARALHSHDDENRRQRAIKIMEWGNLVFGGLVIAQAFSGSYEFLTATIGILLFAVAYFYAYHMMRGGGYK